jgi:hypothetical protein
MQKQSFIICALCLAAGSFGAFIRWLQNVNAFEPDTGLQIPGSLWSVALIIYLAAMALVFLFVVRFLKDNKKLAQPDSFPEAFRGGRVLCEVTAIASFALTGIGGVALIIQATGEKVSHFDAINGGFIVVAAICLIIILHGVNTSDKPHGKAFLFLILALCFRLVTEYKNSASDPVLWHFAIRILAICAVVVAYYYYAGFCFGRAKPYKALYFSFLGIVLSITSFADGEVSMFYHLATAGFVLGLLTLTLLLVGNMAQPRHTRLADNR